MQVSHRTRQLSLVQLSLGTLLVLIATSRVLAQTAPSDSTAAKEAIARANALPVALSGFCPVTIVDSKKWAKGDSEIVVVLDGKKYHLQNEVARQAFLKNTDRYTPALGGDSVVSAVDGNTRVPGSVVYSALHKQRLYVFPSKSEKEVFMATPEKYENVDLALGGVCSVTLAEEKQPLPGKPEFGTVFGGIRYYFTDMKHKKMFLANPAKYALKP